MTNSRKAVPVLLIVLLFLAWQLPGILGRAPWKPDECYTVGLVLTIVETGDWVVPAIGLDPFMEKPTLFFSTAAFFVKALPWLPMHEAARMASAFYNLLTMVFLGLSGRELNGRGKGWPAAVLFMACVGSLHMAHFLITDLALVAGTAMGLYGLILGRRGAWAGGWWVGTGAGVAFLAKGLLGPGVLGISVLVMPLVDLGYRSRRWWGFGTMAGIALLPWATIWPVLLYLRSPLLFHQWFWDNNVGRFLGQNEMGPEAEPFFFVTLIGWYALPASLLVLWNFWRGGRTEWKTSGVRIPLTVFSVLFLVLSVSRDGQELYAMPLLPPLCVLGSRALDSIGPRLAGIANRVLFALTSFAAVAIWIGWAGMQGGWPDLPLRALADELPGFQPSFQALPFIVALVATLAWIWLWRNHSAEPEHLVIHWTAGIALGYLLIMTLFLPPANWGAAYGRQFERLREVLPPDLGPVASRNFSSTQRAMLHYYADLKTWQEETRETEAKQADWLLVRINSYQSEPAETQSSEWERFWSDHHRDEQFVLFRRRPSE